VDFPCEQPVVLATVLTTGLATAYFTREPDRPALRMAATRSYVRPVTHTKYVAAAPAAVTANCDGNAKFGRIAKDGLIGGLLGGAVGAGAGAIMDGGRGAGKGAAIGGITGAVGGGLYGAHQNSVACR
jgi:hypothetical protein